MKKRVIVGTLGTILLLGSCGENKTDVRDSIYINGDVEQTVEVNTTYNDPGVTYPENYTLIKSNDISTKYLGKQEIVYQIYSKDGELVKEMHRFVNVVDTTAPTYIANNNVIYAGISYDITDFITYQDNYDSVDKITLSRSSVKFNTSGEQLVDFVLTDTSGNKATYSKKVNVQLDIIKLLNEVYKYSYKLTTTTMSTGGTYTNVNISSSSSFSYFSNTKSIHYLKNVTTSLGTSASIQISSTYGNFNKASVTYHIDGSDSKYSVGFATIDATKEGVVKVSSFSSTINNLNLSTTSMLEELNNNLSATLTDFQIYMNSTLGLLVK